MKRLLLLPFVLVVAFACDDDTDTDKKPVTETGVCHLADCPKPEKGIACCLPTADCGMDPAGLGFTCQPNPDVPVHRDCVLADCPTPLIGNSCCTPLGACGWDPLASGSLCLANPAPVNLPEGGLPECDLERCPEDDAGGGPKACCQPNGQCGVDTFGVGWCFPPPPPPLCDLDECPKDPIGAMKACCLPAGGCGFDVLNVGLCFPPPRPLCDLDACPQEEGGPSKCCQLNGRCGVDTLGIGLCFPPGPPPTCDLSECPLSPSGVKSCCLPNGLCGFDSLGIGLCFPPPPTLPDGGPVTVPTGPPDDPSITSECPSFLGLFGPVWGCCSDFGVCGTFASGECLLAIGTEIPSGPPPPPEAGVSEPFLRCTPPVE